jgi:hypothetical protein
MFADPITVTIAGNAKTLGRVSTNGTSSVYKTSDGVYTLTISHQRTTKNGKSYIRSMARLDFKKVVADPLTSVNDFETLSTYTVEERPDFGFTSTEVKDQLAGYNTWFGLSASQDKIIGGES